MSQQDKKQSEHIELEKQINQLKRQLEPSRPQVGSSSMIMGVAIELIAAISVGLLIGWFFDNLFASKPFCLIICLIISMIASFKVIWHKYVSKHGNS